MAIDIEYLRRNYASLSDEALLEINRDELVDSARECLDAELQRRHLEQPKITPEATEEGEEFDEDLLSQEGEPEWLDEGAEVYSAVVRAGVRGSPQAHRARVALEAAGIPAYMDIYEEEPEEEPEEPVATQRWRVLVPGNLNLQATNVLQRDLFNDAFEAGWRTHLEVLSDEEVRELDPREVFCGLYDQIERVNRAYKEELTRRRLD